MNILIVTTGHTYWAFIMWKTLCRALSSYHAYNSSKLLLSSFYKRGNWGPDTQWVGLLSLKSRPTHVLTPWLISSLPMLLLQSGYSYQHGFWASWQGFLTSPILLRPSPEENWEGRHEEPLGSALCSMTPRTWMWSRWDPDTHPRLTLSCSALLTLHLDISVYSFWNTFVLTSWKPKYTDRNPF